MHASDRGPRGKHTLLKDMRRDTVLLVIMLLLIVMVFAVYNKIVFQVKNKDFL